MLHSMPCCIQCHFAEDAILCSMLCCAQCRVAYIAMLHIMPCCMYNAILHMLCCIQCHVAYTAVLHRMPSYIHCNVTYKAILRIMLCCIRCHVTYNVMFHKMSCWRWPPRSSYVSIIRDDLWNLYTVSCLALPLSPFVSLAKNRKRLLEEERNYSTFT